MNIEAARKGCFVERRAFGPTRRPPAERLVLILTTLGMIAALVRFVSFNETRSQYTEALLVPSNIVQSQSYYVTHSIQILLLVSAGVVALLSTNWRAVKQGYLLPFTLLFGAALLMTVRGYSLSALLSTKLVDNSGPFPFFVSLLVFVGARRKNWVVLSKVMLILAVPLSAFVLLRLAGLQGFTRAEGVAKLNGVLGALFWPASWIALFDYPRDSVARRLRFLPMVFYACGSLFTQTRLNFVLIFAFLVVYSYLQRRRNSPQAVTWVVGLILALWLSLFTAVFLQNTRAFESTLTVANAFYSRLDDDSRTGQLVWFARSVQPHELLLGRGSFASFYWRNGEYNGGPDVGYLSLLFYGGVPLLVAYIWTHLMPCLAVFSKHSTDWRLAAAGVVLLWGVVMFSSAYPGTSIEYYPVLFCVGACISRE